MSDCENFIHEWVDHYYGVECKNCKLLIPDGIGPWMPDAKENERYPFDRKDLAIDAKGKRARLIPRSVPSRDRVAAGALGHEELKNEAKSALILKRRVSKRRQSENNCRQIRTEVLK